MRQQAPPISLDQSGSCEEKVAELQTEGSCLQSISEHLELFSPKHKLIGLDAEGLSQRHAPLWPHPFLQFRHCYLGSTGNRSKGLQHTQEPQCC